ncbi:hypothetical protein J5N97_026202 [Dioscorea zingiberensis]|uniref:C2 domain-containing protein n=1 Tax=Dioscorea zingiberensis TaxID=325984 RepID=A0A9D5C2X3_9LILI|nr:hypothetical protein J5N97_026202 [Dioscorea zingiberensis]
MKLVVEVVEAHDLQPKDGEGSANSFVEVDFENQRSRTLTVRKNLNPVWNQKLFFPLHNPENIYKQGVEVCVYNERSGGGTSLVRNFLGRVKIPGSNIVNQGEEVLQRFNLEKKWFFSYVKGDIALKLYVDPDYKTTPTEITDTESTDDKLVVACEQTRDVHEVEKKINNFRQEKTKTRTIYHISRNQVTPQPIKTVLAAPIKMQQEEYKLKDTSPQLGERWPMGVKGSGWFYGIGDRPTSTYDLVEQMYYLYVRVVKAKELPVNAVTGSIDPYAEVKLGNYKGTTRHFEKKTNPEWKQVFAFAKERIQSSMLEVFVRDKEMVGRDDFVGKVVFDLNEVPTRVPPDSPLAPQWYRLEDRRGEGKLVRGEIMLAVWIGTQADEAFPEAWHADAASVHGEGIYNIRSKVYVSPKLWYLRVNVIEAQDVQPNDRSRVPEVFVKGQVGNQVLKTRACPARTLNPLWNEDLVFVAAEPFDEHLVLTIEDRVSATKDELLGRITLPLTIFEKRLDHRPVHSQWFNLEKFGFGALEGDRRKELKFSSRIHLRVCLEGAYHVMDESTMYISDMRPTARQLWKPPIGVLELGILSAQGLQAMKTRDGRGATDAYCVAKYGQKWVRTRTIIDSLSPKWNEQYTWEVFDPCTVITLGVFDNCHLGANGATTRDARIGKVRIRLSTLETDRIYTHAYPLIVLQPSGLRRWASSSSPCASHASPSSL